MKKVLIACSENGHDTVTELPAVLKKAGLNVTLMSSRKSRRYVGSYYDRWMESSGRAHLIIRQIAEILRKDPDIFDFVVLGDDALLRDLADARLDPGLKTRIGPIGNAEYLGVLGSKAESTRFCDKHGILTPVFKVCKNFDEAEPAAGAIGYPLMVKIDRSGGGEGVFECHGAADIRRLYDRLRNHTFVVEKFIAGELISIEPLFINAHLVAYGYARMTITHGSTGVSMRRQFKPCPAIRETLETIGKKLNLNGFCNISLIYEPESGRHYLIELDLRPNAWVAYARFAGIDFSNAIRKYQTDPNFDAKDFYLSARERTVSMCYREIPYFLRRRNYRGLLYWLRNANNCWQTVPFYDPRFLFFRTANILVLAMKKLPWSHRKKRQTGSKLLEDMAGSAITYASLLTLCLFVLTHYHR